MLVTLDIKNESMKDRFLNFISTLDYIDIKSDIKNVSDLRNTTNIPNKKTIQAIKEADNDEVEAISFEEFKKEMKQCIA